MTKIKKKQKPRIFYTYQVGAEAKPIIHPWTQLISAFYLRSRFSRCSWRWMEIFSWTWLFSSLCHSNNRRCVKGCLLFLKFWSFVQLVFKSLLNLNFNILEGNAQIFKWFMDVLQSFLAMFCRSFKYLSKWGSDNPFQVLNRS